MLFEMQEIQAILSLLNRLPMTPAEQLFAANFFQRLAAFCAPPPAPKPEPEPAPGPEGPELTAEQSEAMMADLARTDEMAAMADALVIAEALDKTEYPKETE